MRAGIQQIEQPAQRMADQHVRTGTPAVASRSCNSATTSAPVRGPGTVWLRPGNGSGHLLPTVVGRSQEPDGVGAHPGQLRQSLGDRRGMGLGNGPDVAGVGITRLQDDGWAATAVTLQVNLMTAHVDQTREVSQAAGPADGLPASEATAGILHAEATSVEQVPPAPFARYARRIAASAQRFPTTSPARVPSPRHHRPACDRR